MAEQDTSYMGQKSPLQSKKFVYAMTAEITWKVVLAILLVIGIKEAHIDVFIGSIALGIVIVAGAINALYLGGQAGLDKYTRIAQIAANAGQSFKMRDIETVNGHDKPKSAKKAVSKPDPENEILQDEEDSSSEG